jgi:hypothetical protein
MAMIIIITNGNIMLLEMQCDTQLMLLPFSIAHFDLQITLNERFIGQIEFKSIDCQ